jgi:hypothetical protein
MSEKSKNGWILFIWLLVSFGGVGGICIFLSLREPVNMWMEWGHRDTCVGHLKNIEKIKEKLGKKSEELEPVNVLTKLGYFPKCPRAGTYSFGSSTRVATCSYKSKDGSLPHRIPTYEK